jgi:hypothetical protein
MIHLLHYKRLVVRKNIMVAGKHGRTKLLTPLAATKQRETKKKPETRCTLHRYNPSDPFPPDRLYFPQFLPPPFNYKFINELTH